MREPSPTLRPLRHPYKLKAGSQFCLGVPSSEEPAEKNESFEKFRNVVWSLRVFVNAGPGLKDYEGIELGEYQGGNKLRNMLTDGGFGSV